MTLPFANPLINLSCVSTALNGVGVRGYSIRVTDRSKSMHVTAARELGSNVRQSFLTPVSYPFSLLPSVTTINSLHSITFLQIVTPSFLVPKPLMAPPRRVHFPCPLSTYQEFPNSGFQGDCEKTHFPPRSSHLRASYLA